MHVETVPLEMLHEKSEILVQCKRWIPDQIGCTVNIERKFINVKHWGIEIEYCFVRSKDKWWNPNRFGNVLMNLTVRIFNYRTFNNYCKWLSKALKFCRSVSADVSSKSKENYSNLNLQASEKVEKLKRNMPKFFWKSGIMWRSLTLNWLNRQNPLKM